MGRRRRAQLLTRLFEAGFVLIPDGAIGGGGDGARTGEAGEVIQDGREFRDGVRLIQLEHPTAGGAGAFGEDFAARGAVVEVALPSGARKPAGGGEFCVGLPRRETGWAGSSM
jgi:hypothetical protein